MQNPGIERVASSSIELASVPSPNPAMVSSTVMRGGRAVEIHE